MNTNQKMNKLIKIALLAAIGALLTFIELPIFPVALWLKLDFSEIPVLMGGFAFGPIVGIILEGLKIMLKLALHGTLTAGIGELANFIVGISLVVPASLIYTKFRTKKGAIVGMIVGGIIINVVAILANIYLLLPFYGISLKGKALLDYILLGLIPLNTIKAISVSIVTFILYKRLSISIFKVDSNFRKDNSAKKEKLESYK